MNALTRLAGLALLVGPTFATAAVVSLPVDGLDTPDVDYTAYQGNCSSSGIGCISDANSLGAGGGGDHFDEAFGVTINGTGYSTTGGDLTGNTLTLNTETIGQYQVQVQLHSSGPVMRQIVTVTNTGTAGTASVQWHNNTGNDSSQQTIASSDGDLIGEASDRWIVTADDPVNGSDNEVNSWILFGTGAPVTPTSLAMVDGSAVFGGSGEQGLNAIFDLALGNGETAALMWFVGVEGMNDEGISLAAMFDDTSSPFFQALIADLSAADRAAIVNWSLTGVVPAPATLPLLVLALIGLRAHRARTSAKA